MDKPFLRFNDYLGLSSILRSDDVSERDVAAEVQENRPGSSTWYVINVLLRLMLCNNIS